MVVEALARRLSLPQDKMLRPAGLSRAAVGLLALLQPRQAAASNQDIKQVIADLVLISFFAELIHSYISTELVRDRTY